MTRVLLIESDIKTMLALKLMLAYKGFNVTSCSNIYHAKNLLQKHNFQIMIIDIHLQAENMFDFTRSLRTSGIYIPVVYLGERAYEDEIKRKLTGLDDYVLKPLNLNSLIDVLRKAISKSESNQKPLLYSGISIDETRKVLWVNEKIVPLAKIEFKILLLLAKKAGRIVSLEHLYSLYDIDTNFNTRIFAYVSNLRRKLEDAGVESLRINFVRDGYRLEVV